MASKSLLLSKIRTSTCDSMLLDLFFFFGSRSPLRPSLIKKQSMVTADIFAGCVYVLCRRGIISVLSLEIRHPHPTSAWFTRTKLPPTFLTLNSHTWPWILWIFYCLSMTCFLFFSSEMHQVVRKFCLFWTRKDSKLYFTRTLSFLSSSIISSCFNGITALMGPILKITFICFVFCTDFMFLFFWNLTAVSIFGQRLNDTMILSDADPDKHTTYETFSELLRLGDWNSRLDASPCKNVWPSLRLIVMMNLWWLKIPISCFSLLFF